MLGQHIFVQQPYQVPLLPPPRFVQHLYPSSGDGKANSTLDESTIIYLKALNIHNLNPKIRECLFKPNDWVNYLRYI